MPKHDSSNIDYEDIHKAQIKLNKEASEWLSKITEKKVVALIDANIHVTGKYSGREYLFNGAGSVVNVDERDVKWMLEKRQGERQCCGGTDKGNVVFALAEVDING